MSITSYFSALFMTCCVAFSAQATPLIIGAALPLTGPLAEYGQAIKNSISLAEQKNPEDFKNLSFIYEDTRSDTATAVSAFQKLVHVDHIQLGYVWGVAVCKALSPLAESMKVPTIGQCVDPESSKDKKYFIRFMNYSDQYFKLQAEFLSRRHINKIGIFLTDDSYLSEVLKAFQRNLLPGQTVEVIQQLAPNDFDLKNSANMLKNHSYDAVGVFLKSGQIAQLYKRFRELKVSTPTFGTNFFESTSEVQTAQGTMSGAFFVNNQINPDFAKQYEAAFGSNSQLTFGATAFEFATTLAKLASKNQQNIGALDVLKELRSLTAPIEGFAAGPYAYTYKHEAGGYFEFPLTVKVISGNKFLDLPQSAW